MTKLFISGLAAACIALPSFSQTSVREAHPAEIDAALLPKIGGHYLEEYNFDKSVKPQAWNSGQSGLQTSFASVEKLYFNKEVPFSTKMSANSATVWKGERANFQVLVWSADTLEQVRVSFSDLVNEKGNKIENKNFKSQLVRYVLSNYPYAAKDAVCGESPYKNGYMMPDRFESFERFDLPGKTTRPIWVTLDVPANAAAGTYNGTINVVTAKQKQSLSVKVRVQNQMLPAPSEWKHRLDLWQNPWVVAWANKLEPWSPEHKALLKQHLKLYADAGGKYITTYAVHSPWADNSFMIEGGMIEWIKKSDGQWAFDYKIFDEYVQLAMDCGIKEAITLYTPVPWGERFRFLDEKTGNYVYEQWKPEMEVFRKNWNVFLTDLKKHLEEKGWMKIAYLGINENAMNQTLAAIKVIKDHSPEWRITYAGDWHKELDSLLDDYSYLYGKEPTFEQQAQRNKRKNASTTYYVCCNPPYPNNFVFSPPIEGRWISWYTASAGYDGFLRWAYDAWPGDPSRDARHGSWAAGDCYLVYPGGNSCIRFEKLREGIVEFEKLKIIMDKARASKNAKVQQLLKDLDKHMKVFREEKAFDTEKITSDVEKGKALLDQLSDALATNA